MLARATRIRRRRRLVRAGSATAVLVAAALLGPSMASELGMRGADASAAPPPSAIVDLTSAYPVPQATPDGAAAPMPTPPENALTWPSRGAAIPAQAVDVAKSYLLDHTKSSPSPATATVTTLWAQVDEDTTTPTSPTQKQGQKQGQGQGQHSVTPKPVPQQKARKTWLYVMQGWTNGPDGSPSKAQLMVGDYTQTGKASSMSVYATPVTFAHVRPGSADDADDARQIAELSVWLPQSGRLVVLGAPQTQTVLYAKTGRDLVPQKTLDGVAVFPRTRQLVKGHYADTIQVRDAKNVALTPPDAWSAADFAISGAMSLWSSPGPGWVTGPPRTGKLIAPSTPSTPSTPAIPSTPAPTPTSAPTSKAGSSASTPPAGEPAAARDTRGTTAFAGLTSAV